jgi:hypothetical protein
LDFLNNRHPNKYEVNPHYNFDLHFPDH